MKLTDWIVEAIDNYCCNCKTFCDIFGGTGVVTASVIDKFDAIIINDFLFSNEVIYKAFFLNQPFSEAKMYEYCAKFNSLDPENIEENYISINYGDKFFSKKDAILIGRIRELIESERDKLNEKEFNILLASLLYSCDRSSNTCGHYDAYIKKDVLRSSFKYELISPLIPNSKRFTDVSIFREDANAIAKRITADIVYIDPPYSSRQYSRFYHVLENIAKWEKPELFGTAMKPKEENMSEYCKSKALDAFKDLVYSLNCKYMVVSYNNTYDSKSKSSKNKMTLDDIRSTLDNRGTTTMLSKQYKAFSAGKTEMDNHQEILFITEVSK